MNERRTVRVDGSRGSVLLAVAAIGFFLSAACGRKAKLGIVHAADAAADPGYYTQSVLPVFQENCYRCHGGLNHRGGLNMETRESLLKGGHHGPALVPGHPEQSLLVKLIRHEGPASDPMNMPPDPRPRLSDANIATVEAWIRAGAAMPAPAADR